MIKEVSILLVVGLILTLLHVSFFVHLFPSSFVPNLIIVYFILLNVLCRPKSDLIFWAAFAMGFLLDVFSVGLFGFWTLHLVAATFLLQGIRERYVQLPFS